MRSIAQANAKGSHTHNNELQPVCYALKSLHRVRSIAPKFKQAAVLDGQNNDIIFVFRHGFIFEAFM